MTTGYTPMAPDQVRDYVIGHQAIGLLEVLVDYKGDIDPGLFLRLARPIVEAYQANHQPAPQEPSLSEQPGNF